MKSHNFNAFRKVLSVVLTLAMMTTLCATMAFAEEKVSVYAVFGYNVPEDAQLVYEENFREEISTYSSYTSSGSFKVQLVTDARSFDGQNITCYIETYNSAGTNNKYPKTFTVSLYRKSWWGGKTFIGETEISRSVSSTVTWTNVGPGNYVFVFDKANDGTTQYLTTVKYYNS